MRIILESGAILSVTTTILLGLYVAKTIAGGVLATMLGQLDVRRCLPCYSDGIPQLTGQQDSHPIFHSRPPVSYRKVPLCELQPTYV